MVYGMLGTSHDMCNLTRALCEIAEQDMAIPYINIIDKIKNKPLFIRSTIATSTLDEVKQDTSLLPNIKTILIQVLEELKTGV